jgi:hypothetical protein
MFVWNNIVIPFGQSLQVTLFVFSGMLQKHMRGAYFYFIAGLLLPCYSVCMCGGGAVNQH